MINYFINEPKNTKNVRQVLLKIPGVGIRKCTFICKQMGLLLDTPWSLVSENQISVLSTWIEDVFTGKNSVGFEFEKRIKEANEFSRSDKSYKSIRYKIGLPVRGQNTHSNAKTSKRLHRLFLG